MMETAIDPNSPTEHRPDVAEEMRRLLPSQTIIRRKEPLARRTTLRVGGPADIYVEPASIEELQSVIKFCAEQKLPLFLLGRGSNLLVRDGGFRGVVVCLCQPHFSRIESAGEHLSCGAGARLPESQDANRPGRRASRPIRFALTNRRANE